MPTSREDFNESWLTEMPAGIGQLGSGLYRTIKSSIIDFKQNGGKPVNLGNNYFKMAGRQVMFYWHVDTKGDIDIAVEFTVKPQSLIVNAVGKNPQGSEVYASDLYNVVLKDNDKSIRLMSDEVLSDQGFNLWKRLLRAGHTVSVYDQADPGAGLITIKSEEEMEKFFKSHDHDYTRYQYVLSESGEMLAETRSYFNTRRMRELSGLL